MWLLTFIIMLVALCIGGFINVVIYRLPLMVIPNQSNTESPFNLAVPRSHCPKCKHRITWRETIPILSYLLQKGQCRYCQHTISKHYPCIELLTALLALGCFWTWGFSITAVCAFAFSVGLLTLSYIDAKHLILPDQLTLGLLWLGLSINLYATGFANIQDAVLGTIVGYLSLWLIYFIHRKITGKEGLGYGDFKLLACLGAWLGWQALPWILFLASLLGLCYGLYGMYRHSHTWHKPLPFGPFLAFSGWSIMFLNGVL